MRTLAAALLFSLLLVAVQSSVADTYSLGNAGGTFANGTFHTTGQIPNSTGPFGANNPCGADLNSGGTNCSASWTFSYAAYSTVTSASITLGLLGLDSAQAGNQVANFALTTGSGESFTSAFESVAEPTADGGLGTNVSGRGDCTPTLHNCGEYNIYTFDITDPGALTALAGGTATFQLTLSGPGWTLFSSPNPNHQSNTNGATLDFSQLDITGTQGMTPPPVPEPTSLLLLGTGLSAIGVLRRKLSKQFASGSCS
jgi:PEP-CTERM motif